MTTSLARSALNFDQTIRCLTCVCIQQVLCVVVSKEKNASVKEKILTTKKVTTSEEVDKDTKNLDDKTEAVVMTPLSKKTLLTI